MDANDGTQDADELLTPAQVAAHCKVTKSTVSRWGRNGVLKPYKVNGGTVRYRRSDVNALFTEDAAS